MYDQDNLLSQAIQDSLQVEESKQNMLDEDEQEFTELVDVEKVLEEAEKIDINELEYIEEEGQSGEEKLVEDAVQNP